MDIGIQNCLSFKEIINKRTVVEKLASFSISFSDSLFYPNRRETFSYLCSYTYSFAQWKIYNAKSISSIPHPQEWSIIIRDRVEARDRTPLTYYNRVANDTWILLRFWISVTLFWQRAHLNGASISLLEERGPPPQYHYSRNVRDIRLLIVVTVITNAEIFQLPLNWNINRRPFPPMTNTTSSINSACHALYHDCYLGNW